MSLNLRGYNITENGNGQFIAKNGDITIVFFAEYTNGLYSKILSVSDGKKVYHAQRYFYKYIAIIRDLSFDLLKNGKLWDYKSNCNSLDIYNLDMIPYIQKCQKLGIEV